MTHKLILSVFWLCVIGVIYYIFRDDLQKWQSKPLVSATISDLIWICVAFIWYFEFNRIKDNE